MPLGPACAVLRFSILYANQISDLRGMLGDSPETGIRNMPSLRAAT